MININRMKHMIEFLLISIFDKPLSLGPAALISFDVESPIDSPTKDIVSARSVGIKNRIGLKRIIDVSKTYETPFTLFSTGHALLKECDGHKIIINVLRGCKNHGLHAGKYYWHEIDPASDYIEHPEFYFGDLVEEAIKSGIKHEIASHSFSHIPYSLVDDETAIRDLKMSTEALNIHGLRTRSFAFPFNLVGKLYLLSRMGIRIARIGHRVLRSLSYKDKVLMVKTHITDLDISSSNILIKIMNSMVKRKMLLSWCLHAITFYDDRTFKLFEEIMKYLIKKEVNFLTFNDLYELLLSECCF